jgi:hypothetical protein
MERKLKLKNGREIKVTFQFAEGLSEEEGRRRWEDVYAVLLKMMHEKDRSDPKGERSEISEQ